MNNMNKKTETRTIIVRSIPKNVWQRFKFQADELDMSAAERVRKLIQDAVLQVEFGRDEDE